MRFFCIYRYDANVLCIWVLEAATKNIMILRFLYMDIKGIDDCQGGDYIEVCKYGSSSTMAQMDNFSSPYYFTIPNSEFRILNSECEF